MSSSLAVERSARPQDISDGPTECEVVYYLACVSIGVVRSS